MKMVTHEEINEVINQVDRMWNQMSCVINKVRFNSKIIVKFNQNMIV
jgi:hypothetical protein